MVLIAIVCVLAFFMLYVFFNKSLENKLSAKKLRTIDMIIALSLFVMYLAIAYFGNEKYMKFFIWMAWGTLQACVCYTYAYIFKKK